MSLTKELLEQERQFVQTGYYRDVHLHREGSFLRAYDWSAWLCCRYLHDFKVNKRHFKNIDDAVAYIGFPDTSLQKWLPEGAEQRLESDKHLVLTLPEVMVTDLPEAMTVAYAEWKDAIPLTEANPGMRKKGGGKDYGLDEESAGENTTTLTAIMQRVLAIADATGVTLTTSMWSVPTAIGCCHCASLSRRFWVNTWGLRSMSRRQLSAMCARVWSSLVPI